MTEPQDTQADNLPIEEHPLYRALVDQVTLDHEEDARATIQLLSDLYPGHPRLQELLIRLDLRKTLAEEGPIVVERSNPTPTLRRVLLLLFALTVTFVTAAAFVAGYDRFVSPTREETQQQVLLKSLRQDGERRMQAGDWQGARDSFEELLRQQPGDQEAEAALAQIEQQEAWDHLYVEAIDAQQRGDWQAALDFLLQIQATNPDYRDIQQLVDLARKQQALEGQWQEAQSLLENGDRLGAIPILRQIRSQNPSFNQSEVERALFQAYVEEARSLIDQANGDAEMLRQATGYLTAALALQPANRDLINERQWASDYVAGADAAARGDWAGAASHWERVVLLQPDYQGGVLRTRLTEAYPLAAEQLISQANGSTFQLREAISYLDRALSLQPGNTAWAEERRLAAEYVAGAEAFGRGEWNVAIAHWGPILTERPDYQNGALRNNLRAACAQSSDPNQELCSP